MTKSKSFRNELRKWYPKRIPSKCPDCGSRCDIVKFDNVIRLDCPEGHTNYIWKNKEEEKKGTFRLRIETLIGFGKR